MFLCLSQQVFAAAPQFARRSDPYVRSRPWQKSGHRNSIAHTSFLGFEILALNLSCIISKSLGWEYGFLSRAGRGL